MTTAWSIGDIGSLSYVIKQELKENSIKVGKLKYSHPQRAAQNDNVDITGIFGVPLRNLPICKEPRTGLEVPRFVVECVNFLMRHVNEEGLFRKSGSVVRQKEMQARMSLGHSLPIDSVIPDVTGIFKQFVRELPDPLIPRQFQSVLLKCVATEDEILQEWSTLIVCCLLPSLNLQLLRYIMLFMSHVATNSENNKMDAKNLAKVLVPNFMCSEKGDKKSTNVEKTLKLQTLVIEILINNAKDIGIVPDSLLDQMLKAKSHSAETLDHLTSEDELEKSSDDCLDDGVRAKYKKRRSGTFHGIVNLGQRVGGLLKYGGSLDNLDDSLEEFHRETPRALRSSKRKATEDLGNFSASKRLSVSPSDTHLPACQSSSRLSWRYRHRERKAVLSQTPGGSGAVPQLNRCTPSTPMTPLQPKPAIGEVNAIASDGRTLFHFDSPSFKFADDSFQGFSATPEISDPHSQGVPFSATPRRTKLKKLNPLNSKKFKRLSVGSGLTSGRPATPAKPASRQPPTRNVEAFSPYTNVGWRLANLPLRMHPKDDSTISTPGSTRKSLRKGKRKKTPSSPATVFTNCKTLKVQNNNSRVQNDEGINLAVDLPIPQWLEDDKHQRLARIQYNKNISSCKKQTNEISRSLMNQAKRPPPLETDIDGADQTTYVTSSKINSKSENSLPDDKSVWDTSLMLNVEDQSSSLEQGGEEGVFPPQVQKGNVFCVTECKGRRGSPNLAAGINYEGKSDSKEVDKINDGSPEERKGGDGTSDKGCSQDNHLIDQVMLIGDQRTAISEMDYEPLANENKLLGTKMDDADVLSHIYKRSKNRVPSSASHKSISSILSSITVNTTKSDFGVEFGPDDDLGGEEAISKVDCHLGGKYRGRERMVSNISQRSLSSVLSCATVHSCKSNFTIELEGIPTTIADESMDVDEDSASTPETPKAISVYQIEHQDCEAGNNSAETKSEILCKNEPKSSTVLHPSRSLVNLGCTRSVDKTAEWVLKETISLDSGKGDSIEDLNTCEVAENSDDCKTPLAINCISDVTPATSQHYTFRPSPCSESSVSSVKSVCRLKKHNPSRLEPFKVDHTDSSLRSLHVMRERLNLPHRRNSSASSKVQANIELFNSLAEEQSASNQPKQLRRRHNSGIESRRINQSDTETDEYLSAQSPLVKSVSYDSGLQNIIDKTPPRDESLTPRFETPIMNGIDESYDNCIRSSKKTIRKFQRFHNGLRQHSFRRPLSDRNNLTPAKSAPILNAPVALVKENIEPVLLQPLTPLATTAKFKPHGRDKLKRQTPICPGRQDFLKMKYKGTSEEGEKKRYPSSPMDPLSAHKRRIKRQTMVTQQMKDEWLL